MKHRKTWMALLLCAALLLSGCAGKQEDAKEETSQKVLNFGCQMYDDGSVNTAMAISSSWNCMRYGISEALFRFDDNMNVEPWLAESYTVNDEHTQWVITLKKDIKFSDGCPLTPSSVKAYFDYLKEVGPGGSAKPQKYLEYEAEVTADDAANTVTIVTSKPYANLPGQLAYPVMAILDVEHTKDFDNGAIGTGPYMIDKFNGVGVGYDMKANPNYREKVPYDKIHILFMGDASAKTMALQSGQVDLVENITNVSDIQNFQQDANYTVDIASGVRCGFSWMNLNGVLGNKTLRQAILMGIDNDTICSSKTIGGLYTAGFSVLPSTLSYGYDKLVNPYKYDPEGQRNCWTMRASWTPMATVSGNWTERKSTYAMFPMKTGCSMIFPMRICSIWRKSALPAPRISAARTISGASWRRASTISIITTGPQWAPAIPLSIWQTGPQTVPTAATATPNTMPSMSSSRVRWTLKSGQT